MNRFSKFILAVIMLLSIKSYGQLSYGNEQFLFNPVMVNPSMAGLHNGQVKLGYDARWVGINDAPRTGFIAFDKMFNGNTGWNVSVISDRVGPVSSIAIANAFAYHLKTSEKTVLSMSIRHHLTQNYLSLNTNNLIDPTDPLLKADQTGVPINNFDASVAFYNSEKFMIGFSYRNLIPQGTFRNTVTITPTTIQYAVLSLNGWYNFTFGDYGVEAFGNIATSANQPTTIQIGALGTYQGKFGAGLNFSPSNQIGIMAYVKATEKLNVFYNYNLPISDIAKASKQSHGVGISLRLGRETTKTNTFFIQPTNESSVNRMF
jgi:type IX secretion system PorP/SprF family membrane protein